MIKLTVRGKHLQCDRREQCVSCSIYTWPPKVATPRKYHHCEKCRTDILCDKGMSVSYDYFDDGFIEKKAKCLSCGELLLEILWPRIPQKLEQEILKFDKRESV